jgi:type IV pilus assembly protein PilY1
MLKSSCRLSAMLKDLTKLVLLQACLVGVVHAAPPPLVAIPNGPVASTPIHPNTVLDLSVEYPTVGAAYRRQAYVYQRSYLGYFDPTKCYVYNSNSTYKGGKYDDKNDDKKFFRPTIDADRTTHKCDGKTFSGNFMNWAALSAVDMLRYAMTGGDRVIDEVGKTVLQRAVLPEILYGNPLQFPTKRFPDPNPIFGGVVPSDVTPFNNGSIYIISCKNRVLFGDKDSPITPSTLGKFSYPDPHPDNNYALCDAQDNPSKNLGEYVMRVRVCDGPEAVTRPDLCKPYGTNYKPEGEIQNNANEMHFAAMGYLLDSTSVRYGGVLRAPMKYAGPDRYDGLLNKSANPTAEWDRNTGIFVADPAPDSSFGGLSGVINYLNRFGRNGQYKTHDPVGELYYESLRYLQGLQPTPEATAGMTAAMKGDFPVITNWVDPINADCQRNTIILVADAVTNFDYFIPGNTRTITDDAKPGTTEPVVRGPRPPMFPTAKVPGLNIINWTAQVGQMETKNHGDGITKPQLAGLESQKTGWMGWYDKQPKSTYYLSGLSYFANTSDMRKDWKKIRAQTFVVDVDEGGNGKIDSTSTRTNLGPTATDPTPRLSQLYLAAKYGGYPSDDESGVHYSDPYFPPPNSTGSKKSRSGCYPYLWDKNANCDPDNYFLASDGTDFVQAIRKIFYLQNLQGDAVTSVTASTDAIEVGQNQFIYQGKFLQGAVGDLRRTKVTVDATGTLTVASAPDSNSPTLILQEPDFPPAAGDPAPRKIYTYRDGSKPSTSTIPFTWTNLSAPQKTILNGIDVLGEKRLHFLRGSTNDEYSAANITGLFRQRQSAANGFTNLLGDIIHSNPVFVGPPKANVQGAGYQTFFDMNKSRDSAIYVGANDGMLHAFSTDLQKEYFAYIPAMTFSKLNKLTSQTYRHESYVDGGIAVGEAKVGSTWKTVLASAMGGGAQGVFALDITNPTSFDKDNGALWEFSDADDADMGNVFSQPKIAKFIKTSTGGLQTYEYFVVVESGVNNYAADSHVGTSPGGALFLLSLNKKSSDAWVKGVNYYKFAIPNSAVDPAFQSGLSSPALVSGSDGAVRFAYAGDLQGNLWRFDFSMPKALATASPHLLFTAKDPGNLLKRRPITTEPKVVFAQGGGFVVLFGTGKYMENKDMVTLSNDSFYGIYDPLTVGYNVGSRSNLAKRTLAGAVANTTLTVSGPGFSYNGTGAKKGWYFDFPNASLTGERSVTPGLLSYGKIFFNSMIPPKNGACDPRGDGRSYAVNTLTGLPDGGSGAATGTLSKEVGVLTTPIAFDTNVKSKSPAIANAIGKKLVNRTYSVSSFGSKGLAPVQNKQINLSAGRLTWREILNYQELHDAPW